ncbi:MAG: hypothetical protein WA741_21370, partial [Candidatus Sulfotelmatobacter sp.]
MTSSLARNDTTTRLLRWRRVGVEFRLQALMISHLDWKTILVAALAGGALDRIIGWVIAWIKERREQRSAKTSHGSRPARTA